ncbi:hypothetical protein RRG08_054915 [Elysia crispata]|uniref:EGF-like calcium-binding domain-containing protein n=1 Tax=Elysia crispata TaxID=231223 RepID=A0AAE1EF98_9GAST|nr:hypothetical protein RRG08_054915 [Elysia crispata]
MTSNVVLLQDCGDQLYTKTSALHNLTFLMPSDISTDMAEYRDHLKLKDESRNYKARVKDNVKKDPYLSEMLQCLTKWESSLYYERKLNVQNLTVYDYRNGQGHCNVWSEVDAMRGSYEIALQKTSGKALGLPSGYLTTVFFMEMNRMRIFFAFLSGLVAITSGLESHCEELKRCSPEPISFPTKAQLKQSCTPPVSTDAEWCWLSNYHTCEDESLKSKMAMHRRTRNLQCQLKDDLNNETLLERVLESECIKQKMDKLITDVNAVARHYQKKVLTLEEESMSDRDGQICRTIEDMIRTFHRVSEPNCGEAVAVYVSKLVLSQANSNNRIYKCLHYDAIKNIVGRSEGCEALYHCWNTTQNEFGTVLNNLRNQSQINIFCSQKGHRMTDCWTNYEGQCEPSMWRTMVEEELRQMQLICLPDFKDVASIMSYSALVSVASTVLDCEENFLQIYPGLVENRGDLEYLENVFCRNIDHLTECIKKGVYVGLRPISNTHLDVLYNQARSIALKRQLRKLFFRCHKKKENDIDECHENTRNCKSIEDCENRIGIYRCTACKSGYRLTKKKRCIGSIKFTL